MHTEKNKAPRQTLHSKCNNYVFPKTFKNVRAFSPSISSTFDAFALFSSTCTVIRLKTIKKKRKLFSSTLVHRNLFNIKPTDVTVTMKVLTIKDTHTKYPFTNTDRNVRERLKKLENNNGNCATYQRRK